MKCEDSSERRPITRSNRTLTDAVSSKPILGKGLVKWESFAMRYVHDSVPGLGRDDRRDLPWHYLNSRNLASFRGACCGGTAGSVWHRHGDFVGHQNAARLFSVFCVRRSVAVSHMPDSKGRR